MNYYNPYFYSVPLTQQTGLFSKIFNGLSFGKILNGTERALNFANQAIPLIKQVKPIVGNAKTMFKVMNEFKRNEVIKNDNNINTNINNIQPETENGPKFFA